jgi:RNA polymerase sigma-70 factor (ECF subfamily)
LELDRQFRKLVDQHYGSVWACVSVLTGRAPDTEDLVHEAFLLAFDRLSGGTPFSGDPGKWLRGTARHLAFAWWRKKRDLPEALVHHLELLAEQDGDPLGDICRAESVGALRHCLEKLPDQERALVRDRYERGESTVRIAERTLLNPVTVRTRLHRIRQALRRCMETAMAGEVSHGA